VVHDTLFETTVTICIILNTAFLAIEHHGMSQELDETLETGNKVSLHMYICVCTCIENACTYVYVHALKMQMLVNKKVLRK
jgi:hypothetical protein